MSADPPGAGAARRTPHWLVIGLATVGVLAVFFTALLLAFGFLGLGFGGGEEPARVADKRGETIFVIGQVQTLAGTDLVRMDIAAGRSEDPYGSIGSGSGGQDVRNILLLDRTTGASRKLLPDNSRHIEDVRFLAARADKAASPDTGKADDAPPAYYLLTIRAAGKGRGKDVLVGALASARQAFVMRGIAGIETSWMQSPTQIGLIVRENLSLHYRIVDIPTLRVVTSRPVQVG